MTTTDTEWTHIAHWLPGWAVADGIGFWELQTREAAEYGLPTGTFGWFTDPDCIADAELLTPWIEGQLNAPVVMEPASRQISRGRFWRRWQTVPYFRVYVTEEVAT
jgi:hypothetical protein